MFSAFDRQIIVLVTYSICINIYKQLKSDGLS